MRALLMLSIVLGGCAPSIATAQPVTEASAAARTERPLVFVLTTGLEDIQAMSSVFRHAHAAVRDGRLPEVAVIVYGRGIQAFDGSNSSRPAGLPESIRAAMDAGVRVVVCAQAMQKWGIDEASLDPAPTAIAPNAITTLIDYVAQDAAVVRY